MRAVLAGLAAAGLLGAAAHAGCGGEAGDLIALEGTGGERPAHRIVVTGDGRGSCDGGELRSIPSERLIDAREVERELGDLASESASVVRWSEGARELPSVLPEASLLALRLERELCR
jgi:hypothetical protein